MSYHDVTQADYDDRLRVLETTDQAHADTFNPLFDRLIKNDVVLHGGKADGLSYDEELQALVLKANGNPIDRCPISFDNGSLADESDIREMAEKLLEEAGAPIDDHARIADDEDIEEVIEGLDDI